MSDYTKLTDFASKDALPSGDANKIVKGTEIDDEFEAIETAIATKADTTYVDAIDLSVVWPVGSVYINAGVATNPATLLGFGTWTAFGSGRVLAGYDAGTSAFDTLGKTGGSADAIVVSHTHTGTVDSDGAHTHVLTVGPSSSASSGIYGGAPQTSTDGATSTQNNRIASNGAHTHTFTTASSGSSATDANLQPYITVYMWQRTA